MNDSPRKTRPDDVLGNLPPEQQDQIIHWLGQYSYAEVLKKIAASPPEGLGLEVQYTSLRRFYNKHLPDSLLQTRREDLIRLRDYAELMELEPAPYEALTKELLQRQLFYQAISPEHHDDRMLKYLQLQLQWRVQDLKEKYYELAKARFETHGEPRSSSSVVQVYTNVVGTPSASSLSTPLANAPAQISAEQQPLLPQALPLPSAAPTLEPISSIGNATACDATTVEPFPSPTPNPNSTL